MIRRYIEYSSGQVVEALQFFDRIDRLVELSNWFKENGVDGARVSYEDPEKPTFQTDSAWVGVEALESWYIIKDEQGRFSAAPPAIFIDYFAPCEY